MGDSAFKCQNCGATRSVARYEFRSVRKVIRECAACKLMVLDPLPTEEELKAVYSDGYFDNAALTEADVSRVYGYVDYIAERAHKQRGYAVICRRLRRLAIPAAPGAPRLLDHGCGLGFFLDSAFEAGFDVGGLEFNRYAIEYMRKRYAYPVAHSTEFRPQTYDVITMFDVIEHLRHPFAALDEARDMLSDRGILVVSTMDSTSVTSRLMGKRLEDFRRISEHLFFFSRSNLTAILRRKGFDVLDASSLGHSFEIRLLATRLRSTLPLVGLPMLWFLRLFPFVGSWSIYLNPRTKFILYARKRQTPPGGGGQERVVSLVVPVGNDAATVEPALEKLLRADLGDRKELIIATYGSDESAEIVCERLAVLGDVRLVRAAGGEGAAVAKGFRASRGSVVVLTSPVDGYDASEIAALVRTMAETGALAVYGSRYSGRFRRTGPFLRTAASRALTAMANLVNDLNLSDLMVGCKAFDGPLARNLNIRSAGMEFEAEIACRLRQKAVSIYEVPLSFDAGAQPGGRRVGLGDAWRTLAALVRYGLFGAD